jgi:lactoylglutathione lyase
MAVKKFEHVGIMVKSIEDSVAFYQNVLGLELKGTLQHIVPQIQLAFLGFPGDSNTVVELIQGYNDSLPEEGKVHHLAFTVDDIEAEVERLRELNVKFIDDSITTLPNGMRYIFFYGPDGEHLELFQPA